MMDGYGHDGVGWGGWLLMSMMMLIFWSAVVVGAIALWRSTHRDGGSTRRADEPATGDVHPDARQLLDERFARGEIEPEDYARRRDMLTSGR